MNKTCNYCEQDLPLSNFEHLNDKINNKIYYPKVCKKCYWIKRKYKKDLLQGKEIQAFCVLPGYKFCNGCKIILSEEYFHKLKNGKCRPVCMQCRRTIENKQRKEKRRLRTPEEKRKDNEKIIAATKKRRHSNISFKIKDNFRINLRQSLKTNCSTSKNIFLFLGCNIEKCRKSLENKFLLEMTWENHGKLWDIDHIIPRTIFDTNFLEGQFICWNYQNLSPLLKIDNDAKSDFLPDGQRARNLPKIQSKQQLLDLIQTWPNPADFDWVKEIDITKKLS